MYLAGTLQTEHISESGFYSWRKKLSATPSADTQTGNPKSPFVQVDMALATQSPMTLQLAGGHRLQIANQVDANTLVKVLGALREAKLC